MKAAIILLVALWPLAARGGRPAPPDSTEQARAAYLRARQHYDAGRFAEAVKELKEAYELKRFSALLRYIGDSYYAMKKYRLALKYYRTYLARARYAQDKVQVGLRIRELEDSLSVNEEGGGKGVRGAKAKLPAYLVPDGRDVEVPAELRPASAPASAPAIAPAQPTTSTMTKVLRVAKWSSLGIGVAAFAVGLTYNLLARSKAGDLEQSVRTACPGETPGCAGNPDLAHPVSAFSREQYDLELTYQRYQNRSTVFFIVAGAAAAASAALFVVDWRRGERRTAERRMSVAPAVGEHFCGLSAEGSF